MLIAIRKYSHREDEVQGANGDHWNEKKKGHQLNFDYITRGNLSTCL